MSTQISNNLLRIPSENGSPINEYRINQGEVEFRSFDSQGKPPPQRTEGWRSLGVSDIQLHFALKTAVAQWLMERLNALSDDDCNSS